MSEDKIREAAEADLATFIKLVAPHRVLGHVHKELLNWWTRQDAKGHQLVLLPRDHQKSAMIAYRVAWEITKNPAVTILYISSAARLAEKQLYFIKNILTSKIYRRYWPEMVEEQEGIRDKWTNSEIIIDHPTRKEHGVRDPTVFTAGLTTSITGLHFEIAVLDDVVVKENAYTEEGRQKVAGQYSLLSSIESTGTEKESIGAQEWAVGTRYHAKDLYNELAQMQYDVFDKEGEIVDTQQVYEVFQKEVEDRGDGRGEFLWPRQQNSKGRWYGFDANILSVKKSKYLDKVQFHSQYYNNPNDPSAARISSDKFQYYNKRYLEQRDGYWFYKDNKLNVFASIDFAFSLKKKADYTTIAVVGIDADKNIYVLDLDRFKTDRIAEYFKHILEMYIKWEFKKLRAEVTVAQQAIVRELKETYIKQNGLALKVEEFRPTRNEGTKEERMSAILEPRYDNLAMWHYQGGWCQTLEEELIMAHPPHDDLKDALASAVDLAVPPLSRRHTGASNVFRLPVNRRFGGITAR